MLTINSTYTNPTSELSFWEISDPITQCSSEATKESEELSWHTLSVSNVKSICRLVQWLYHRGRGTDENEVACLHTCPTNERFTAVGQFSSVGGKAFLPIPVSAGGEVVTPLGGEVSPICWKSIWGLVIEATMPTFNVIVRPNGLPIHRPAFGWPHWIGDPGFLQVRHQFLKKRKKIKNKFHA